MSNCSELGFGPKFTINLKGGHERGDNPTLKAVVTPRSGDANLGKATVTLPPKIFLAQENIETICTPKQFDAKNCPKGSIYGKATATTPLLGYTLAGPVYLRANPAHKLPDLVVGFQGPERTLRELGSSLGVSAERVRQIEQGALDKLREAAGC